MNRFPNAIIWDLDGTLIDSAPDLAHTLNTVLAEHGHSVIEESRVRTMIGNGVGKLIERGFAASDEALTEPQLQELTARFMDIYTDCATAKTRLYSNTRSILQQFSDAGVLQGLCTNKPETISRQILDSFSLTEFFAVIIGGDSVNTKKPDPQPLQKCLDVLEVTSKQSVLIGDSEVDVATARAVNMRVGIASHGYSRVPASTLGADFVVDDLAEVPNCLIELS